MNIERDDNYYVMRCSSCNNKVMIIEYDIGGGSMRVIDNETVVFCSECYEKVIKKDVGL
jgi:NAD-dependent SIR2 family protein deacetylase